jgi:hypothetical protein
MVVLEDTVLIDARFQEHPDTNVYGRYPVCSSDIRAVELIPVTDCGPYRYRTEVRCLAILQITFSLLYP